MKSPCRVTVIGAGGRMGKTLIRCILADAVPGLKLAAAVDLWDCPDRGRDAGVVSGAGETGVIIGSDLARVADQSDVWVDFSGAHGTAGNIERAAEWGRPVVIGTTGLSAAGQAAVDAASKKIAVVQSPNMSLGINILLDLVLRTAASLRDRGYDIEVIERHHRNKKDAPSGTALALGRAAATGMGWDLEKVARHGRSGVVAESRPGAEIGFHAIRGGDFVGDHTVLFSTQGESVELSHRATNRDTFALGALQAAAWISGRSAGLYTMRHVLGLDSAG